MAQQPNGGENETDNNQHGPNPVNILQQNEPSRRIGLGSSAAGLINFVDAGCIQRREKMPVVQGEIRNRESGMRVTH
jgi:hypothetical protein